MPTQAHVQAQVDLPPAAVWAIVSDFCRAWHPLVATMQAQAGGTRRTFTVTSEDTIYVERLTYRSDSDRVLRYTHVQGIAAVDRYDAEITVTDVPGGTSQICWRADITADPARAEAIAAGSEEIFRQGIAALPSVPLIQQTVPQAARPGSPLVSRSVDHDPRLSILTNADADTYDPQLPLCLFLHGIGGQKENWLSQLRALVGAYPVAALDLRGYGGSDLGQGPSTIEDYCADIATVRAALGARPLVLCGLSYGAWIATSYALRHGQDLAGLVLAGGCTGMSEADVAERDAFRTAREVPLDQGQTPADFAPAVVDVIAGPRADADLRETLRASMAAIPAATYRDALRCFTDPPGRFDLGALSMPVLLMTGAHDRLAPPDEIRSVAHRIWAGGRAPHVRFEILSDAGHVCNLEAPSGFNAHLTRFLHTLAP